MQKKAPCSVLITCVGATTAERSAIADKAAKLFGEGSCQLMHPSLCGPQPSLLGTVDAAVSSLCGSKFRGLLNASGFHCRSKRSWEPVTRYRTLDLATIVEIVNEVEKEGTVKQVIARNE